jgi:hypothetical protein
MAVPPDRVVAETLLSLVLSPEYRDRKAGLVAPSKFFMEKPRILDKFGIKPISD